MIIQDINGCADTATNQVEVLPKPHARFVSLLKVCQGDTIEFQNQTTFPGSSLPFLVLVVFGYHDFNR
ncbi:MAG: hypothetical protein R3B93_24675 [Bacteroidia bacterium]